MTFDWQTIAVVILILAASAYVARRGIARLRSFGVGRKPATTSCEVDCGSCGDASTQAGRTQAQTLVKIVSSRTTRRKK